ncbi:hypothetical protein A6P39_028125 [Streptomyces sp. FXJ1.172]|uniref:hypothetical protein n=1 Tax=Streptomyces sp. FXJ1.172 TaxID=710705 RepID=UPI0007CEFD5F|nr:hypothetical protein [Streptomyces sp. FXJ1.172]WEO97575.1 hypothetical protein A6P39_028125 [Streptomyces sp. FXJ1.172]
MAWDEWEQLKSEARQRGSAKMQIDHLADPGGGGGDAPHGDLTVCEKDLKAVGDAAYALYTDFDKDSDLARISSFKAAGGLTDQGFVLGEALDHVATRWVDQVQNLLDACVHIYTHLDYTQAVHKGDEERVYATLSSISTLDKGFDEHRGY